MRQTSLLILLAGLVSILGLAASGASSAAPKGLSPLVVYGWAGYMPQPILDGFTHTYGLPVAYLEYDTQEDAVAQMRAGEVYDVVIMSADLIPSLVADGLLAEIDYRHVPNVRNLSPNFRDLAYDPGNRHAVMIQWGTTGLVVRTDLVDRPVRRWADLWDIRYAGEIGVWPLPRDLIGITLKTLGYSYNSEDPEHLAQALDRLLALKKNVFLLNPQEPTAAPYLLSGQTRYVVGWSYDALAAQAENSAIAYVLPEEGTVLWGDNVVIPANSANQEGAETFLNYLLRPEVSAKMVNELYVATPNEAAAAYIDPEILQNPIIYPSNTEMAGSELALPLSAEGQQRYEEIWRQFEEARP